MASNLIGLVTQLQHMESAFAAVLMEAALKLSALTETNVFLLIETSDTRKFGGKSLDGIPFVYKLLFGHIS